MRGVQNGETLRRIHTLFDVGTAAGLTDGELLERYTSRGGEAAELAFAALVERHGPVVYRVCRRMLRDPNDAQDAFQAAFLVLVRKAASIRNRDSVGSWLYGVALRVASDSRAATSRRLTHERNAARPELEHARPADLTESLLEEVGKLPEKFRVPIVLCDLEGYTCEEVARRLGWPLGTVRSRLTRGKERLRSRLERRGLAPSSGVIAAALRTPAEAVPPALLGSTLRTAVSITTGRTVAGAVSAPVFALSEGVVRAMVISKLKTTVGIMLAAAVAAGRPAGVLAQQGADPYSKPRSASPRVRYEIRISVDGKPSGEPIVAEVAEGSDITVTTPEEAIHINRKPPKAREADPGAPRGYSALPGMGADMRPNPPEASAPKRKGGDAKSMRRRALADNLGSDDAGSSPPNMMSGGMMRGMGGMMGGMMGGKMGGKMQVDARAQERDTQAANSPKADPNLAQPDKPGSPGQPMTSMMRDGLKRGATADAQNAATNPGDGAMARMMGMMGGAGHGAMTAGAAIPDQEKRLQELERKLDEILKRLDDRKPENAN